MAFFGFSTTGDGTVDKSQSPLLFGTNGLSGTPPIAAVGEDIGTRPVENPLRLRAS
jgi:hypothetical protein